MEREQIENIYKINGLTDYKLNSTEDILKVHGVDFKAVDGYNRLDDLNRDIYKKFIVNIFNAWGLGARATLVPKGIYFVEDISHLGKENIEDDYFIPLGGTIKAIDRSGLKSILHTWNDKEYKHIKTIENEIHTYLRFEYENDGEPVWLHIEKNGEEWY
jgi:hypothetical protein